MSASRTIWVAIAAVASIAGCSGGGDSQGSGGDTNLDPNEPTSPIGNETPQGPSVVKQIEGVTVSTLAGSDITGAEDGTGAGAQFDNPVNLALGPSGELIVADFDNSALRRVTPDGVVTTLTRQEGFVRPFGLAFGPTGELYAQTDGNTTGQITNETGALWQIDPSSGAATLLGENMGRPRGMTVLGDGMLVLVDYMHHTVRQIDPATRAVTDLAGANSQSGFVDGPGVDARFRFPYGADTLPDGRLVLADQYNHRIRIINSDRTVQTLAGDGVAGMVDGPAAKARFYYPQDVSVDGSGAVFVADRGNARIRRINPSGEVETVAGNGLPGYADGNGADSQFFGIEGLAVTSDGKTLYVADGTGGERQLPFNRVRLVRLP